jgi:hypothetical protein
MKTFIALLITGMLLVIAGALLKIENAYENVSIFDARTRSLDTNTYVKELLLINFSTKSWNTDGIGFPLWCSIASSTHLHLKIKVAFSTRLIKAKY